MGDLVKITLTGQAKIDGEIRAEGWSGEVGSDIAQQLRELGAVLAEAGDDPVLVEPVADPRDELIEGLKAEIEVLQAGLEVASGSAAMSVKLIDERDKAVSLNADLGSQLVEARQQLDQALARNHELAAELAPFLLAQAASAEPAPAAAPTKKTRAASST